MACAVWLSREHPWWRKWAHFYEVGSRGREVPGVVCNFFFLTEATVGYHVSHCALMAKLPF